MEREHRQRIIQSIRAENPGAYDEDWAVWHELEELVERNAITDSEALECWMEWLRVYQGE